MLIGGIDRKNLDSANPFLPGIVFIPADIILENYIAITYCILKGLRQAMLTSKCCV